MWRARFGKGAGRIALVGVLAALSLIVLYLSAVSPAAQLGIVAIAGVFPAGAVVSAGLGAGFFCYGAAGLLGLLLVLLGGIPLLITLWTDFYGNEAAFPPTKSSNKQDNP